MKKISVLGLSLLTPILFHAQLCGHTSDSWANSLANLPKPSPYTNVLVKSGTPRYIPLKIHYIRHSDGTFGNNNDPKILIESILQLNQMWNNINVQFYLAGDIHYIDNSAWLTVDRSQPIPYLVEKVPGMANVFVVDGWTNPNWASGWGGPDGVEINTPILSLVSHEFGHFMSLAHTFDTGNGIENVDRSGPNANCATAGDGICDTDADPYGLNPGQYSGNPHKDTLCHINSNTSDMNGQLYNPPYDNIMSYHTGDCGRIYTPGQYAKMITGYDTYHAGYADFTGAGTVSNGPSSVQQTMIDGIPYITWINQNGSMGTSIEYSTDGGTSWYVAGGVLDNITQFPLYGTKAGTTYTIRLKHINSKNNYSNSISYNAIHSLPEKPFFNRQKTTDLQSIGGVKITNTLVNNQSNDNQSYSLTTYNPMPEIQVGTDYPLELKIGTGAGGSGGFSYFAVYLDENNDGDYGDANETKYIKSNGALEWTVTTNLNISTTAIGGPRILRVRSFYQTGIQQPDNFSVFSETEDYAIFIKTTNGTAEIKDLIFEDLSIYPNPTQEVLNVNLKKMISGIKCEISTIDGKILAKNEYKEVQNFQIDLGKEKPGIYFIELFLPNGASNKYKISKL